MFANQSGKDVVALIAVNADGTLTVKDRSNKPVPPMAMNDLFQHLGSLKTTDMKTVAFTVLETSSSPIIIRIVIDGHVYCFQYIPEQGGWVQIPCP